MHLYWSLEAAIMIWSVFHAAGGPVVWGGLLSAGLLTENKNRLLFGSAVSLLQHVPRV